MTKNTKSTTKQTKQEKQQQNDELLNKVVPEEKKNILKESANIFLGVNILLISIAFFLSKTIMFLLIAVMLGYLFLLTEYAEKKIKKLKIYYKLRPYLTLSKSINHACTLTCKFIFGLPISDVDKTEMGTFLYMKDLIGEKWPFMMKVKNTREKLINVNGKDTDCISSYNYLNFGRDERVQEAAIDAARAYSSGNHGPRMLCGNLQILEDLEVKISEFFNKEAALVFSSGFLACMSTISGISRRGDLLLMDKLTHASLKHGAKTCNAKVEYFKHNDFKDAERIIKKNKFNNLIMVIEGIYSMDGDVGNLPEARKLVDKYNGTLILDEAHSLGTIGKTGRGTEEYYNYVAKADIICGSFTKAISSVGGYLVTSRRFREFYTFYAPGQVFSAPLSAYHAGAAMKAFEILTNEPEHTKKLQENSEYMRKRFVDNGFDIGPSYTCVIPVTFRDIKQVMSMHDYLLQKGFFSAAVMAPACPVESPRFRITVCSNQSIEDLDRVVNIFIDARKACPENPEVKELIEAMK